MEKQAPPYTPVMGCLARLFWMFIGNAVAVFCLVYIAREPAGKFGVADLLYAILIAGLILVRYLDIRCYAGETADGNSPASLAHWRRYTVAVAALAATAWLLVRAFAWFRSG